MSGVPPPSVHEIVSAPGGHVEPPPGDTNVTPLEWACRVSRNRSKMKERVLKGIEECIWHNERTNVSAKRVRVLVQRNRALSIARGHHVVVVLVEEQSGASRSLPMDRQGVTLHLVRSKNLAENLSRVYTVPASAPPVFNNNNRSAHIVNHIAVKMPFI